MKKYEAPQAQVVSFDNEYVMASSRSKNAVAYGWCNPSDQTLWAWDNSCRPIKNNS